MSTGTRIPLALARSVAEDFELVFAPFCWRIAVAGSIRRERPEVGDIEIVALPRYVEVRHDLFGNDVTRTNLLADALLVHKDVADLSGGDRMKKLH